MPLPFRRKNRKNKDTQSPSAASTTPRNKRFGGKKARTGGIKAEACSSTDQTNFNANVLNKNENLNTIDAVVQKNLSPSPTHTSSTTTTATTTSRPSSPTLSYVCINENETGTESGNDYSYSKSDDMPQQSTSSGDPQSAARHDKSSECAVLDSETENIDNDNKDSDSPGMNPIPRTLVSVHNNAIGHSLHIWMSDMDRLLSSTVFQDATHSTLKLAASMSKAIIQISLYPIIKPIQFTSSMINSSLSLLYQSTLSFTKNVVSLSHSNSNNNNMLHSKHANNKNKSTRIRTSSEENGKKGHDIAHPNIPSLYQTTQQLVASTLSIFFGQAKHCQHQIKAKGDKSSASTTGYHFQLMDEIDDGSDSDYVPLVYDDDSDDNKEGGEGNHDNSEQHLEISSLSKDEHRSIDNNVMQLNDTKNETPKHTDDEIDVDNKVIMECCKSHQNNESDSIIFCIRVSDLDISKNQQNLICDNSGARTISSEEKKEEMINSTKSERIAVLQLKLPSSLIDDLNAQATVVAVMNAMVEIGLDMMLNRSGEMFWQEEGSTAKLLKRIKANVATESRSWFENSTIMETLEKEVLTWSGGRKSNSSRSSLYAPNIPMFRGRGMISSIGPEQLTELLLDSNKVTHYNRYSKGRSDLAIFQDDLGSIDGSYGNGTLKIVESETKVPLTNSSIKMVTLMHARPITLDHNPLDEYSTNLESRKDQGRSGYIMVSRSVSKVVGNLNGSELDNIEAQNEIIWGVNVLLEVPEHEGKTEMITLTQAKSSAVPNFLVNKVGIMGAGDFFKNVRSIKVT